MVLERNWLLEAPKSLRKPKTMVRGPPPGLSLGSHLRAQHGPGARSVPEGILTRSKIRIASKVDF